MSPTESEVNMGSMKMGLTIMWRLRLEKTEKGRRQKEMGQMKAVKCELGSAWARREREVCSEINEGNTHAEYRCASEYESHERKDDRLEMERRGEERKVISVLGARPSYAPRNSQILSHPSKGQV
jgi:hypothetical protein